MSADLALFFAMLAGGLLTFGARALFIFSSSRFSLGPRLRQLLAYVPPAVLAALIAPEILLADGQLQPVMQNPRLGAALIAGLAAFLTRNVLATIASGMAALWALQAML